MTRYVFNWQSSKKHTISCITGSSTIILGIHVNENDIQLNQIKGYYIEKRSNLKLISKFYTPNLIWISYNNKAEKEYEFTCIPYTYQSDFKSKQLLNKFSMHFKVHTNTWSHEHKAFCNRAISSSAEFKHKFGTVKNLTDKKYDLTSSMIDQEYMHWLSNGFMEQTLSFLDKAQKGDVLYISSLEITSYIFIEKLKDLQLQGIVIYIIVDGKTMIAKAPKTQLVKSKKTGQIKEVKPNPSKQQCHEIYKSLVNNFQTVAYMGSKLFHSKYIVHEVDGEAKSVLVSSGNFSDDCFFGNFNTTHIFYKTNIATSFKNVFNYFYETIKSNVNFSETSMPMSYNVLVDNQNINIQFLPKKNQFQKIVDIIKNAQKNVFITMPFELSSPLIDALCKKRIQGGSVAILDKEPKLASREKFYQNHVWNTYNNRYPCEQLLGLNQFALYLHAKVLITNYLSKTDNQVLAGSYNFSLSCDENVEVILTFDNHPEVADFYFTELIRLFSHFYTRDKYQKTKKLWWSHIINAYNESNPAFHLLNLLKQINK